jgi:hypothetical protein
MDRHELEAGTVPGYHELSSFSFILNFHMLSHPMDSTPSLANLEEI